MEESNEERVINFDELYSILNDRLYKSINKEEFEIVADQVKKLLEIQKLKLEDIEFFENGQSYTAIGVGNVVLKIGPEIKCVKNPYQLLPFHQESLEDSKQKMYLCHKAATNNLNREDAQKIYNQIRDIGGLWTDPKENNLGRVNGLSNINESFENNVDLYDTGIEFSPNDGNNYIIDCEDVIFLTPEIINNMDKSGSWSTLPYGGSTSNRIYTKYLETQDIDEIYEQNYIYPDETLLTYELQYQKEKGNIEKMKACKERLKDIENKRRQAEYETKQRYIYNRGTNIGKKYSAKEIGIRVLQKTNLTRVKDMVSKIKERFKSIVTKKQKLLNGSNHNEYEQSNDYYNTDRDD